MRRVLISLVAAVAASLALSAVASAEPISTDFEAGFNAGTVDGQDGWHSAVPGDVPALPNGYDQEVESSGVPGFGALSLRHSNALSEATGEFEYQTYSKPNAVPAGEAEANTEFDSTFQFVSTSANEQPGLKMRISPDDSHGGRMSFVSFTDTPAGIVAQVADTPEPDGAFRVLTVPGTYSRTDVHTVRIWMKLVPGPDNDIVRIFIDGEDIGNKLGVCLETWENFYRQQGQHPPVTNSLGFRADNGSQGNPSYEVPGLRGGGYWFDNVATTTANGAGPAPGTCGAEGQIAPTGSTCEQYRDGTAPVLEQVQYTTTRGDKINAVSPGVFFYYSKVSDGTQGETVDITEDPGAAPAIPIQNGQVVLYDASTCKVLKWKVTVGSNGTAEGKLPSSGDFIVGVKYSPSSLKGKPAPTSETVTYSFGTELDSAVIDGATIDLVKK